MARTEQSRQKKLAKKRSKEISKRKKIQAEKNALKSLSGQIAAAARGEFHRCFLYERLLRPENQNIGSVFVSRFIPNGKIVVASFLIDPICLGVKDTFARLITPHQYSQFFDDLRERYSIVSCTPAMAKKFVNDSIDWAGQFGFSPHRDFAQVSGIWPDVDPSECKQEFEFGVDGKPSYVQGPYDSTEFVARVIEKLETHVSSGDYQITASLEQFFELTDFNEDDMPSLLEGKAIKLGDGSRLLCIDN